MSMETMDKPQVLEQEEMRLRDPLQSFSGNADRSNAEIVDKLLGTAERKRARPTSSLDIKVEDGDKLTHPPTKFPSQKSRGGRLPQKYQLSDLDGMSEDELLQALYDDPELAATAAAAAEKIQKSQKKSYKKPRTKIPRSGGMHEPKRINQHPAHLEAMMKDGVPVTQWIILLVVLGAGIYQLRKTLIPTSGVNKAKRPSKQSSKKGKKSKSPRVKLVTQVKLDETLVEDQKVKERKVIVPTSKSNKKKKARKQKSKRPPSEPTSEMTPHDQPDSISTDGSSSTDGVTRVDQIGLPNGDHVVIDSAVPQSRQVEVGWTTVGNRGKTENKSDANGVSNSAQVVDEKPLPDTISTTQENQRENVATSGDRCQQEATEEGNKQEVVSPLAGSHQAEEAQDDDHQEMPVSGETVEEKTVIDESAKSEGLASNEPLPKEEAEGVDSPSSNGPESEEKGKLEEETKVVFGSTLNESQHDKKAETGDSPASTISQKEKKTENIDNLVSSESQQVEVTNNTSAKSEAAAVDDGIGNDVSVNPAIEGGPQENTPGEPATTQEATSSAETEQTDRKKPQTDVSEAPVAEAQKSGESPLPAAPNDRKAAATTIKEALTLPASPAVDTTDDEALAKRLQLEEERLAKPLVDSPTEEAWAEVPIKRKKKQT